MFRWWSRILPSSLSGHPSSRRKYGRSSSQAISAWLCASWQDPRESQYLGAMYPAASVETADGVRLAPPLHRLGPLLGHVVLSEALQGTHEFAVDDARRERIELPGHSRDPGLVEQRQALPDVPIQDEQPGFGHPSNGTRRGSHVVPTSIARRAHCLAPGVSPVSIRS